jgi:hypothetical protein
MDENNNIRPDVFNKMIAIITDLVVMINTDQTLLSIPPTQKGKGKYNLIKVLEQIVSRYLQNYLNSFNHSNILNSFFPDKSKSQTLVQINRLLLKIEPNELENILQVIRLISAIKKDSNETRSNTDNISLHETQVTYSPPKHITGKSSNISVSSSTSKKKQKMESKQEKKEHQHFTFSLEEIASFTTKSSWQPNTFKLSNHEPNTNTNIYNQIQNVDTKTKLINAANLFKCKKPLYIFYYLKYYLNGGDY